MGKHSHTSGSCDCLGRRRRPVGSFQCAHGDLTQEEVHGDHRLALDLVGSEHIHGAVAVTNVPLRSLRVAAARRLFPFITQGNRTVLNQPVLRALTTVRDLVLDGDVQRGAIRARLAA
jgi:hypothetical protein